MYQASKKSALLCEMTADELEASCRTFVALQARELKRAKFVLGSKFSRVEEDEAGYIRVYDEVKTEDVVKHLYDNGIVVTEIKTDKIGLEEYYIDLMKEEKNK